MKTEKKKIDIAGLGNYLVDELLCSCVYLSSLGFLLVFVQKIVTQKS
jgi:hypothetical protein